MDLAARKYHFIEKLLKIDSENIMAKLENVLGNDDTIVSASHKKILQERIDSFEKNPEELLDWDDVKNNW